MKQAQSEATSYRSTIRAQARNAIAAQQCRWVGKPVSVPAHRIEPLNSWSAGHLFMTLVTALWFTVTLPFRLAFWMIAWLGRLTAVLLGFLLMVLGIALWAGPLFFIGIPLFVVGLILMLRCLD
jgi:hypothetical protein